MIATSIANNTRAGHAPARVNPKSRYEHVIVVKRATELEELGKRFTTVKQARFMLERAGQDIAPIEARHQRYHSVLDGLRGSIPQGVKSQLIERDYLPQFTFGEDDLVVTVGPDGLVVNTAKYLRTQPIFAINPDPGVIEGILLPFSGATAVRHMGEVLLGKHQIQSVTMAKATLNNGQSLLAFNDLFIGPRTHTSARYQITHGKRSEEQSSSGIIVSTGAGSTGWLKSVYAGAAGIIQALGGNVSLPEKNGRFGWDEDYLVFAVREPWPSKTSKANVVFGVITKDKPLVLASHMAGQGVIFSDGIEQDSLGFNAGQIAQIGIAEHKAKLIILATT
jgi:NAD kinase